WQNRVLWQKARLLDPPHQPKYKVWVQHPNPKTRHTITNGQKVPLEKKFEVINDKTGQIDMMDYPGDWTGSPANTANCLCTLEFTNDDSNLYKPEEYSVTDAFNELKEKTEKLKNLLSHKGIKLVDNATLLATKQDIPWIINRLKIGKKERNRMRITDINRALTQRDKLLQKGYLKSDFNLEIAHGKIWLDHTVSSRDMLNIDSLSQKSNSHSYNVISRLLNGRLIDKNKYSEKELDALDFYSRDEYYSTFNAWQRDDFSMNTIEKAVNDENSPLYGRNVNELKNLFQENFNVLKNMQIELDEDMIMYHGQKKIYSSDGEELKDIGEWKNTISLGLFRQSGEKYAVDDEENKSVLYRIYVPKGTKVTPILQMSQRDYIDESELLLSKGHKYKIDSYYKERGYSVRDSRLL
ncbi:MAG: hypothetical protein BZ136_08870, partial [Methanosphaera sp. rholeuAM74]